MDGVMDCVPDLAEVTVNIWSHLSAESTLRKLTPRDSALDYKAVNVSDAEAVPKPVPVTPRANFKFDFPKLESLKALKDLSNLQGLLDLDQFMFIAGFAEVGLWGSSRTRWELEARGEFTIEGCIEMAWIMGFIKQFDGKLPNGSLYVAGLIPKLMSQSTTRT